MHHSQCCLTLPQQEYAGDGLRTLVLAYKDLDSAYVEDWEKRHHEASTAMDGREERLDELYEEIEKDLMVGSHRHCLLLATGYK